MRRALVLLVLAAAAPAAAEPTTDYVVQDGDTCLGIAIRELGDRTGYAIIHKLNPQLGNLPHVLKAGQVLRIPRRRTNPDARLTGKSGDVRVRRPTESAWDAAARGMDLFRAWRVGAEDRSSAEVTFSDTRRLYLREHTIVVIYGPELKKAKVTATEAVLERGTLRSRLGELSGSTVRVTTPTAVASLSDGSALVTVADDGQSTVANHDGKSVDLRGLAGGRVAVASGMGSRVKRGKEPEPPRPLPPAPTWTPGSGRAFAALVGRGAGKATGATVTASWQPVKTAAWYRLEVVGPGGATVLGAEVPHTVTRLELRNIPPGAYRATIAAIDADRFEGPPAESLALDVVAVPVSAPGRAHGPAPAVDPDQPLPPPAGADAAPLVPVVAIGSAFGDGETLCEANGRDGTPLVMVSTGPATLLCSTAAGVMLEPFAVEVAAVTGGANGERDAPVRVPPGPQREVLMELYGPVPLGDRWRVEPGRGLTVHGVAGVIGEPRYANAAALSVLIEASAEGPARSSLTFYDELTDAKVATVAVIIRDEGTAADPPPAIGRPTPRPARGGARRVTAGAYTGFTWFPTGAEQGFELGDPALDAYQVDSGTGAGMRAAFWLRRDAFVEADLTLIPTGFVAADEPAWVAGGHVFAGFAPVDGPRLGLRGVVGAGAYALLGNHDFAEADVDADLAWGATGTLRLSPDWSLRLDGRHHLVPDRGSGGVTNVFAATLGIEAVVRHILPP